MNKVKENSIECKTLRILRSGFIVIFLWIIVYSLYQILDTNNNYMKEAQIREQMARFKPTSKNVPISDDNLKIDKTVILNKSIAEAQKINSDIVGWLTLDNTRIDYPFVKAQDNDFYLHKDINKMYSYAGTVFMDYRCENDLSNFSNILYGHNMKNGTMFSDIRRYDNAEFFDNNRTGKIYLVNKTYNIEIFAYMMISSSNNIIYDVEYTDDFDRQRFLTYIAENSLRYRDILSTKDDKLLILSTCTNNFDEVRSVLVAQLINMV